MKLRKGVNRVTLNLSAELLTRINTTCRFLNVSRSGYVEELLRAHLDKRLPNIQSLKKLSCVYRIPKRLRAIAMEEFEKEYAKIKLNDAKYPRTLALRQFMEKFEVESRDGVGGMLYAVHEEF